MVKKARKLKKKSNSKKGGRRVSRKISSKVNPNKRDFEVFAKGVERLEEIRGELNSLDTKGYEEDVKSIKSKLKNVSYIPEIEEEMRILRQRIGGSYKEKRTRKRTDDHGKINSKIAELEKEIKKRGRVRSKRQLSGKDRKLVESIPRFEGELKRLRNFIDDKKKEEKRKRELLNKIDPGVSFLINNKFNLTLGEIKAELSKKLKDKELVVQKQLHDDLELRKKNFEYQYKQLEDRFVNRYNERVKGSLGREVKEKFNDAVREKIRGMKKGIQRELKKKTEWKLKELDREKKNFKDMLIKANQKKVKVQEEKIRKYLGANNFKELKARESELKNKLILNSKRLLEDEKSKLKKEHKVLENLIKVEIEKDSKLKQSKHALNISKQRLKLKETKLKRIFSSKDKRLDKRLDLKEAKLKKLLESKENDLNNKLKLKEGQIKKELDAKKDELKKIFKGRFEMEKIKENEARKKLSSQAKQFLDREKLKLDREYDRLKNLVRIEKEKSSNLDISREALEKLRKELREEFEKKRIRLEKEHEVGVSREKDSLKEHFDEEVLLHKVALDKKMKEHLTNRTSRLKNNYDLMKARELRRVEEMKRSISREKGVVANIRNALSLKRRKIIEDDSKYKQELVSKLEGEKMDAIKKEISGQSQVIREKLRKEFGDKLRLEIKAKEAEFEKRKADLALELQKKARLLFN